MVRWHSMFQLSFFVLLCTFHFCPFSPCKSFGQNYQRLPESSVLKANAFLEECILLENKFRGVELQSKTGLGCIITSPWGQNVLVMPGSIAAPIKVTDVDPAMQIQSRLLLAARVGSNPQFFERMNSFSLNLEDLPMPISSDESTRPFLSNHRNAHRKIYRALAERCDLSFKQTALADVLQTLAVEFDIPILLDESSLDELNITQFEPVTIQLPDKSLRIALRAILSPLSMDFVVEENRVRITAVESIAVPRVYPIINKLTSIQSGIVAHGSSLSSGNGSIGGESNFQFTVTRTKRYTTLKAARQVNLKLGDPEEKGIGNNDTSGKDDSDVMEPRREFCAIQGPLATIVNSKLGIAFVSLPGDFRPIQFPTHAIDQRKCFTIHTESTNITWIQIAVENDHLLQSVLSGSPIVDEFGEPFGLYINKQVLSFQQIFQESRMFHRTSLGYWDH